MPQRQVSTTHSTSTLTVSRERQKPASSIVKPTCIPNTRNAATNVHVVLIGLTTSLDFAIGCSKGSGGVASAAASAGLASADLASGALASAALASAALASGALLSAAF